MWWFRQECSNPMYLLGTADFAVLREGRVMPDTTPKTVDLLLIEGYRLTTAETELRAPGKKAVFMRPSKVSDGKSSIRTEYIRKSRSQTGPNKGERFAENRALNTQLVVTQDPRRPRPSYPHLGPFTHTNPANLLASWKLASMLLCKEQWRPAVV